MPSLKQIMEGIECPRFEDKPATLATLKAEVAALEKADVGHKKKVKGSCAAPQSASDRAKPKRKPKRTAK